MPVAWTRMRKQSSVAVQLDEERPVEIVPGFLLRVDGQVYSFPS